MKKERKREGGREGGMDGWTDWHRLEIRHKSRFLEAVRLLFSLNLFSLLFFSSILLLFSLFFSLILPSCYPGHWVALLASSSLWVLGYLPPKGQIHCSALQCTAMCFTALSFICIHSWHVFTLIAVWFIPFVRGICQPIYSSPTLKVSQWLL